MSRRFGIQSAVVRVSSVAVLLAALAACSDRSMSITGSGLPPASSGALPTGLGIVEGNVDSAGNVTLTPLQDGQGAAASYAPGIDGNVYAGQNVNVRVYANAATQSIAGGTKTWKMEYGVRNYLPYPIGSNQGGTTPTDTTGIYLVFVGGPTVTAHGNGCGACTMNISRYDGVGNFTSPNQKYLYWRERLAAKQVAAGADTVSHRDSVFFTSPTAVTNFKFYMMVGADWPAPHQNRWSVFYNASTDSAPDLNAKPLWRAGSQSPVGLGTEVWSKAAGVDSIRLASGRFTCCTDYFLYRRDSLAANTPAYMDVQVKVNGSGAQPQPETNFGFLDGSRMAAVGLTSTRVGFIQYQLVQHTIFFFVRISVREARFISSQAQCSVDGTTDKEYLLRKFGTDSLVLTVGSSRTRCAAISYSQLPIAGSDQAASFADGPAEFVGQGSSSGAGRSAWTFVAYGIGATQP